jgi:hypothetical protein
MTKENLDIDEFLVAINNLLGSKYILVDRRISDVLLSIADTKAVYNLIAECMINFDFRSEWKKATQGISLKFPESDEKKISFIFCLLSNIDDGTLDITKILEKYFSYNPEISPYELFCKEVVVEFRDLIVQNLSLENYEIAEEKKEISTSNENLKQNFEILADMLRDFRNEVSHAKKLKKCYMQKQDIVSVISAFEQVVRENRVEYFYSFMVTLRSSLGKNKEFSSKISKICQIANDLILGE